MTRKHPFGKPVLQFVLRVSLSIAVAFSFSQSICADTCYVVKHGPPTEAEKALLAGDYTKAVELYQSDLSNHSGDPVLTTGLVHALLHQQKVNEAEDAVKTALATAPNSAPLLTLRGEVELRLGMPWLAEKTVVDSFLLDPCNPRTHLLYADLARKSSRYASARQQILAAHELDPADPEIRLAWIYSLPLKQRTAELEAYLSTPTGDEADDLRHAHLYLDHIKKLAGEPRKACHLASSVSTTEIPFLKLMYDAEHTRAFGLPVELNGKNARLEIDTGASGLVVSRSVAKRAKLIPFSESEASGIGDEGPRSAYTAYADSIRIGNLEFKDCTVEVVNTHMGPDDEDGLIGMDVFSRFLVTLDYPWHKLVLGPLPPRPEEEAVTAPSLKTDGEDEEDSDSSEAEPGKKPAPHGPYDRYIAPEMQDYTPVYRVGHDLILPANLNDKETKLFIMDTGAWTTTISPDAAREVTKVHRDLGEEVSGISGDVRKVYEADQVTFRFAHILAKEHEVVAFDTSKISKDLGMEISGFIGANALKLLTVHIDYRDGLVKFDYKPNVGYRFM